MGAGWPSAPRNGWIGTSAVPRTADKNSLGNPPTAKKPLRRRESCNLARPDRPLPSVSSRCRPAGLHPMRSHTPLNPVRPLPRRPGIFEARSVDLPLRDHLRTTCVRHRRPPLQTKDEQCWTIGSAPQVPQEIQVAQTSRRCGQPRCQGVLFVPRDCSASFEPQATSSTELSYPDAQATVAVPFSFRFDTVFGAVISLIVLLSPLRLHLRARHLVHSRPVAPQ